MHTQKNQQVVLLTGASSGIGKETALLLHKQGYQLYAAARRLEHMKDLRDQGISILPLDITKEKSVQDAVSTIIKESGQIDILLNIAGMGVFGSVEETDIQDAQYQFDVNIIGMGRLIQQVVPHMRKAKKGKIVNVSSMIGKVPVPLGAWYVASKHAVEGFSDCLRIELKPFGIDVIIVEPGVIQTSFGSVAQGPFLARSGKGPYKQFIGGGKKKPQPSPSDPSLVADTIAQAIQAKNPDTRYVIGLYAKELLALRKKVSDREMDQIVIEKFV